MNPIALILLAGAGWYLWQSGALGALPARRIDPGLLMDPPQPPVPTAPTTRTSGMGGGSTGGIIGGIAAGVGLLVYGITEKGWFRGGEEGVKVNPARDDFFGQFQRWCLANGFGSLDQQAAAATVLQHFTSLDGNQQNALIVGMYQADTIDKYVSAGKAFANVLEPAGFHVEIPV